MSIDDGPWFMMVIEGTILSTYWGDKMGNWNRHFVRVGSDGNVGIFSQSNDEFVYLDDTEKEFIVTPVANSPSGYFGINRQNIFLNRSINNIPESGIRMDNAGNLVLDANTHISSGSLFFNQDISNSTLESSNKFQGYNQIVTTLNAFSVIAGSPDLRTGVTTADASAITIFSSTKSGTRYEVKARILATSGSSATYTISWTEGGVAQTVALTITAVDTEVHDNFVIAPDANTNITAQITALTSSTVNVDAIVSVLG